MSMLTKNAASVQSNRGLWGKNLAIQPASCRHPQVQKQLKRLLWWACILPLNWCKKSESTAWFCWLPSYSCRNIVANRPSRLAFLCNYIAFMVGVAILQKAATAPFQRLTSSGIGSEDSEERIWGPSSRVRTSKKEPILMGFDMPSGNQILFLAGKSTILFNQVTIDMLKCIYIYNIYIYMRVWIYIYIHTYVYIYIYFFSHCQLWVPDRGPTNPLEQCLKPIPCHSMKSEQRRSHFMDNDNQLILNSIPSGKLT